jgi:hypothetical protein
MPVVKDEDLIGQRRIGKAVRDDDRVFPFA